MAGPPCRTWSSEVGSNQPPLALQTQTLDCQQLGLWLQKGGLRARASLPPWGQRAWPLPYLGWGAPEIQVLLGWGLGLAKSQSPQTQEVAFQLAQNWIRTNFDVYSQKSTMYEKVS